MGRLSLFCLVAVGGLSASAIASGQEDCEALTRRVDLTCGKCSKAREREHSHCQQTRLVDTKAILERMSYHHARISELEQLLAKGKAEGPMTPTNSAAPRFTTGVNVQRLLAPAGPDGARRQHRQSDVAKERLLGESVSEAQLQGLQERLGQYLGEAAAGKPRSVVVTVDNLVKACEGVLDSVKNESASKNAMKDIKAELEAEKKKSATLSKSLENNVKNESASKPEKDSSVSKSPKDADDTDDGGQSEKPVEKPIQWWQNETKVEQKKKEFRKKLTPIEVFVKVKPEARSPLTLSTPQAKGSP